MFFDWSDIAVLWELDNAVLGSLDLPQNALEGFTKALYGNVSHWSHSMELGGCCIHQGTSCVYVARS